MKNFPFIILLTLLLPTLAVPYNQNISSKVFQKINKSEYTLVVEGFDWGAAVSKVILPLDDSIFMANGNNFSVDVKRATTCRELKPEEANGKLKILFAYASDERANRVNKGNHITLVLHVAPFETLNSPMMYFGDNPICNGNRWVDFQLRITHKETNQIWNKEKNRIIPLVDKFNLTGRFTNKNIHLTYADYAPPLSEEKSPLIIWLHGAGEGGKDPSIALLANRAANYASQEIQTFFGGAFVLVPQTPTFWMDNGEGKYTTGEVNDMYNDSLMELIKDYVKKNPRIDKNRIYIGGCSNGGYMTLKLILLHPKYFAAGFPSAIAYQAKHITNEQIKAIKDVPIWFIHSEDDPVCQVEETVIPIYKRLKEANAKNAHLSLFNHVVDITNQFGGNDFHYHGHLSWIYSHANKCQLDYDGTPVILNGNPVSLMGWMARQSN